LVIDPAGLAPVAQREVEDSGVSAEAGADRTLWLAGPRAGAPFLLR
jgi:hypothetical protein